MKTILKETAKIIALAIMLLCVLAIVAMLVYMIAEESGFTTVSNIVANVFGFILCCIYPVVTNSDFYDNLD